jgi:hypothetical protein
VLISHIWLTKQEDLDTRIFLSNYKLTVCPMRFFHQQVGETVDLYLVNDTHLSTQGYKLMALKIADEKF